MECNDKGVKMKNKKEVQELVENIRLLCDARNSISNPTKALIHNTIKVHLTELKKLIDKQPDCDSTFKELREALRHSTTRENDKRKIIDGLQDKLYAADRTRINLHKVIDEYSVRIATLLTRLYASYKVEMNFAKRIKNLQAQLAQLEAASHQNYCTICGNTLDGYIPPKDKGRHADFIIIDDPITPKEEIIQKICDKLNTEKSQRHIRNALLQILKDM